MNYQTDQHDNLSADELRLLAPSSYGIRRTAIAKHPNTPADTLELFYTEGANKYVRSALAGNANTPQWILDELYECADGFIASGLAKNPKTTAERVLKFSYWDNPYVRFQAVKNPLLPEYRVRELLRDGAEWVQWGAKKRLYGYVPIPELPGGDKPVPQLDRGVKPVGVALHKVENPRSAIEREAELVRRIEAIGRNSEERERQAKLAAEQAEEQWIYDIAEDLVRTRDFDGIATCDKEVVEVVVNNWGTHKNEDIRLAALRNPLLGERTLNGMISTQSIPVRLAVLNHPNATGSTAYAMRNMEPLRLPIANHSVTPIALLHTLSKSKDTEVAEAAKRNLTDARERLRAQREEEGLLGYAFHTAKYADEIYCSVDYLERIAECSNPRVLKELAAREWDHWSPLAAIAANPHTPEEVLEELGASQSANIRQAVAANPSITPSLQRRYSKSGSKPLLVVLAGNPVVSEVILEQLTKKAGDVGEVARQTLATIKEIQAALLAG